MKRGQPGRSPLPEADTQMLEPKRPKGVEPNKHEASTHVLESGPGATASTTENDYVAPFAETGGSSVKPGLEQAAREDAVGSTSPFQDSIAELESQENEKRKELLELDRKVRDLYKAEVQQLQGTIREQCVALKELTNRADSLTSERDELQAQQNALQAEHAQEVNKTAQLSAERERLGNENKRLQDELDQEVENVKSLTTQIVGIIAEKDNLLEEKRKVEGDLTQERQNLAQHKDRVAQLTQECDSLRTTIGERDKEIARKDSELSSLQASLDTLTVQCNNLQDREKALLDALNVEKDCNSRELAKRDEMHNQTEAELRNLRAEYEGHLDECKPAIKSRKDELKKCKEALEHKSEAYRLVEVGFALHRKHRKEDFARAHKLLDESIRLDADALLPRYHKACVYYHQEDYAACVQTCIQAVDAAHDADKCVIAILFELAAGARVKQADIPPNVQQLEEKPEQLSYLKDAIQFYGQSVANYAHDAVERKHKFYADKLRDVYVNPGRAQEAEKRGNEFFKDEDYEKAVEQYDEAVRRDPGNAQLHLTRAWCHLKRTPMRCAKAIADCKTAIDLDPSNAKAYIRLGAAQQAQGHRDRAEQSYRKALELVPTDSEAEGALTNLRRSKRK